MAIQDEMFKRLKNEIKEIIDTDRQKINIDNAKALRVAKMLTELSTDKGDAETLVNQYIANIKNICNE